MTSLPFPCREAFCQDLHADPKIPRARQLFTSAFRIPTSNCEKCVAKEPGTQKDLIVSE